MKIIYLHQYYNNKNMSGGTRSYEFAKRLVEQGHEVHLITAWRGRGRGHDWFKTNDDGINVHWLPVEYSNHMPYNKRIKAFFKFAFGAAKMAVKIGGDIIFATSTPLTIAIPAAWAKFKLGIPIVFEVRDLWPELPIAMGALRNPFAKFIAKILERFAYFNSRAVVALSPGMKEGVIKTGYPRKKVAVIPNSSDTALFDVDQEFGKLFRQKRPWLSNSPILLYTGTFGVINGVSYLVDLAVEFLQINSNIKILVIGDGAEFDFVVDRAKNLGVLEVNFFVEQGIPKSEIASALSAATFASALFIDKPEMRANSANKFFDALAAGKPLVINYGGWMHNLVIDNNCGVAAWKLPLDQVAFELNEKSQNPEWLSMASQNSRDLAYSKFSRDFLSEKLNSILVCAASNYEVNAEEIAPDIFSKRTIN